MTNDVFKKNDVVYSAVINGVTVVLNMETGRFFNLDEVGCLIWQLLNKPSTLDDIIFGVSKECEVSVSECKDDVTDFIKTLSENYLITKITEV